ncbi:DUF2878 domain-containing protein [Simiduia sp. 21SJ11W-1]|uniref:DUF2878 domain-containing protein n=1 Tax=Simiduia sp. 21SJ11W-1 TaxID=2909669 RepID=UPI00209F7365|nr:DUF2878 domain-containing protein [Simiduia sp. 21SJ11W-1]UTA48639.1 DUF2878 domain-containing protein [Simiduia sp. 21SJ11W-1]
MHDKRPAQRTRLIANALLFQLGWWAIVLTHNLYSLFIIAIYLAVHFWLLAEHRVREAVFIALATCLGALVDLLWFKLGILQAEGGYPLWLLALWPLFLSTLYHSLAWLGGQWLWAALLGAVFAPLSYWGGVAFTPVSFADPWLSTLALGAFWLVYLPACFKFKQYLSASTAFRF